MKLYVTPSLRVARRLLKHDRLRHFTEARVRSWKFGCARVTGRSHRGQGLPCQDQVVFKRFPSGAIGIALADGAGSAPFSRIGAQVAVNRGLDLVEHDFDHLFRHGGLGVERGAMISRLFRYLTIAAWDGADLTDAERRYYDLPPREVCPVITTRDECNLASTLLVAVVKGSRLLIFHIGDGVIGFDAKVGNKRAPLPVSLPLNGDSPNETVFTTSRDANLYANVFSVDFSETQKIGMRARGVILMSDGSARSLYNDGGHPLAPATEGLFNLCRGLPRGRANAAVRDILRRHIAPRTSDDCSVALLAW